MKKSKIMPKQYKFRAKWSVITILIIFGVLTFLGYQYGIKAEKASQLDYFKSQVEKKDSKLEELIRENEDLRNKINASAKIETKETTKKLSRYYIEKYFGNVATKIEKVMTCESNLNNQLIHVNKPGLGVDRGIYQLNDKWHKDRFEKMFNIQFEIGAHDFQLSTLYAKYLYEHSGLNPWVCSKLVSK